MTLEFDNFYVQQVSDSKTWPFTFIRCSDALFSQELCYIIMVISFLINGLIFVYICNRFYKLSALSYHIFLQYHTSLF